MRVASLNLARLNLQAVHLADSSHGIFKNKNGQLALTGRIGADIYCRELDPILTTPGGWGLRNPVPKGPGQRSFPFIDGQRGGGLTEFRRYYDLPNVRVMCVEVDC